MLHETHNNLLDPTPAKPLLPRINWHKLFIWTALALVGTSGGFITYKLYAVWQAHPDITFVTFLDMHPPMALFSGLIVVWFIDEYEGVAIIALFSTMLNALLV